MNVERVSLLFTAAMFAGFGVATLLRPREVMSKIDLEPTSPTGLTEIRAMYGGLGIGMAAFFTYAALKPELVRPGLLAQTIAIGGLGAGRIAGIAVDDPSKLHHFFATLETAASITGAVLLAKGSRAA